MFSNILDCLAICESSNFQHQQREIGEWRKQHKKSVQESTN